VSIKLAIYQVSGAFKHPFVPENMQDEKAAPVEAPKTYAGKWFDNVY